MTIDDRGVVSSYFSGIHTLQGSFLQTSADNRHMKGKFFDGAPGHGRQVKASTTPVTRARRVAARRNSRRLRRLTPHSRQRRRPGALMKSGASGHPLIGWLVVPPWHHLVLSLRVDLQQSVFGDSIHVSMSEVQW